MEFVDRNIDIAIIIQTKIEEEGSEKLNIYEPLQLNPKE